MKIIFLTRDRSNNNWLDINIEAWSHDVKEGHDHFTEIESIRFFMHKDLKEYNLADLDIRVSGDGGTYSFHKTKADFIGEKTRPTYICGYTVSNEAEYTCLRNKIYSWFAEHKLDFKAFKKLKS